MLCPNTDLYGSGWPYYKHAKKRRVFTGEWWKCAVSRYLRYAVMRVMYVSIMQWPSEVRLMRGI